MEGIHESLLLQLCCFFGDASIPTSLLHRGSTPRRRWNEFGEVVECTPAEAGIHPIVLDFLADDVFPSQAFEVLVSNSQIHWLSEASMFTVNESIKRQTVDRMDEGVREVWTRQALLFVAHASPRPCLDSE